jgi:hypothetical protein
MTTLRIPRRIYKRRAVWHWLADAGAPEWLWQVFARTMWLPCGTCGWRGRGRHKRAMIAGGGQPTRHYCAGHMHDCGPF